MVKRVKREDLIKGEERGICLIKPGVWCSETVEVLDYAGYVEKRVNYPNRPNSSYMKKTHYWNCKCHICGNVFMASELSIVSGVKSCGCNQFSGLAEYRNKIQNGEAKRRPRKMNNNGLVARYNCRPGSLLYIKYHSMIDRCYSINNKKYPRYGGRGIKVDPIWANTKDNLGLINFAKWAYDNGYHGEKFSVERLNPNGNYGPDNCMVCHSNIQQANNKESQVKKYTINNMKYTMAELCRMYNGSYSKAESFRMRDRMAWGFTPLEAVLIPKGEHKRDYAGDAGYYIHNPDKVVCPIYFIDYPQVDPRDPLLQYMTVDKVAFIREKEAEAQDCYEV